MMTTEQALDSLPDEKGNFDPALRSKVVTCPCGVLAARPDDAMSAHSHFRHCLGFRTHQLRGDPQPQVEGSEPVTLQDPA